MTLCHTDAVQCAAVTVIMLQSLSLTHEAANCAVSSKPFIITSLLVPSIFVGTLSYVFTQL